MNVVRGVAASSLFLAASAVGQVTSSHYVPMDDDVRLAIDVHLPFDPADEPDEKLPALLQLTRYWRASEDPDTGLPLPSLSGLDRFFVANEYAVIKVDVRGSGASFGVRDIEYSRREVQDGHAIIEWVVSQHWSDGRVGAYGTSYSGTTAGLLAASGHPALKAVIPGWSDYDAYRSPARPYGLVAGGFIREWGALVGRMDANDADSLGAHVRRVDGDDDGALRDAAVREHAANIDVARAVAEATFRDQSWADRSDSFAHASAMHWKEEIEASGVPMLVFASWFDAGTAGGALERFRHFSNPQHLIILASSHGGSFHASPFAVSDRPLAPVPNQRAQFEWRLVFFEHYVRGSNIDSDELPPAGAVHYFNIGDEAFRTSHSWPPLGTERKRWHLQEGHRLTRAPPEDDGADEYRVDRDVSTGDANRWMTQMGNPVLSLDDRGAMDARMLVYDTAPLDEPMQITGAPVVSLHVASDHDDGAFLVYLEVIDDKGRSRYLTEGGLRAIHRARGAHPYGGKLPYRTFAEADASPLTPGEVAELRFALWPVSALVPAGHRLRLAIAGADAGTFDPIPATGRPVLHVERSPGHPSWIELPTEK